MNVISWPLLSAAFASLAGFSFFFFPSSHRTDDQREGAEVDNDADDHIGDILVVGGVTRQVLAYDFQHGHEHAGEDNPDGIIDGKQGHG